MPEPHTCELCDYGTYSEAGRSPFDPFGLGGRGLPFTDWIVLYCYGCGRAITAEAVWQVITEVALV
ncbi:MAG: hypothetical protein KGH75_00290 [Rhodospirillales bacterium]|nr:hypothetical protein [Rhodospirillales bacterium]